MGAIQTHIGNDGVEFLFIGEDRQFDFNHKDIDGVTALDISGWSGVIFELMKTPNESPATIIKILGDGITVQNGVGTLDQAHVVLSDADTELLTPGRWYWRTRRGDSGSELHTGFGEMHWKASGL